MVTEPARILLGDARAQGTIILLDTGAGNGEERPYAPAYAHHEEMS